MKPLCEEKGSNILNSSCEGSHTTHIRGSAGGEYPYDKGQHLIVVAMRAYADESETHENPAYCVVAGWIGNPRQWRKFNEDWQSILDEFRVTDFHSKQFFSLDNPYRTWKPEKVARFITKLTRAIAIRRIFPVGGAVKVEPFMSYSEGERRWLTMAPVTHSGRLSGATTGSPNKPYHAAVPFLYTEAAKAAGPNTQVHFVFDRNETEQGYALKVYNDIFEGRGTHPLWDRLGEFRFADRISQPGLQAADLYTHLWWAFLEHGATGMGEERHRVFQGMKLRREWIKVADTAYFEEALAKLTSEQRRRLHE